MKKLRLLTSYLILTLTGFGTLSGFDTSKLSMNQHEIENRVKSYYNEKLKAFGPTARGVDWNGEESQILRFEQLDKLIDTDQAFSILDYGCGYGAMYEFLLAKYGDRMTYYGYDLSVEMVEAAQKKHPQGPIFSPELPKVQVDYVVASGIFNVKMEVKEQDWEDYIKKTLQSIHQLTVKGFAFNILTSYSDPPYMKEYLYYAQPEQWFGYCKLAFSPWVALNHDYPLYEFCIIVRI